MEFHPSIYIGLGVIVAAIITGVISFVNLVTSKDQKTSEFRQEWIEGLREDICIMLARVDMIGAEANLHNQLMNAGKMNQAEALKAFADKVAESHRIFTEKSRKAILRLNKKDDKKIIDLINKLDTLLHGSFHNLNNPNASIEIEKNIINEMQKLLKDEWKRVKKGEPSFWVTKYAALITAGLAVVIALSISADLLEISINLLPYKRL